MKKINEMIKSVNPDVRAAKDCIDRAFITRNIVSTYKKRWKLTNG